MLFAWHCQMLVLFLEMILFVVLELTFVLWYLSVAAVCRRHSIKAELDSGLWTPDFFSRFLNEKKKEKIQLFLKKENKMKIKNFKTFKK